MIDGGHAYEPDWSGEFATVKAGKDILIVTTHRDGTGKVRRVKLRRADLTVLGEWDLAPQLGANSLGNLRAEVSSYTGTVKAHLTCKPLNRGWWLDTGYMVTF